jgi:molybdate transport system regulatory protein
MECAMNLTREQRIHRSKPSASSCLVPRINVWLEVDGQYAFGSGLIEMLRAIDKTGSFKHAAAKIGLSYRYVWKCVKEAEKTLGWQLVEAHVGGKGTQRSWLTDEARQFIIAYEDLQRRLTQTTQAEFARRPWTFSKHSSHSRATHIPHSV